MEQGKRQSFSGSLGFVLAAAGSAVGLGNLWRFPYLAARDGGGLFLVIYLVLALTFGFALLITEVAIGRKTKQSPLTAYGQLHEKWRFLGIPACLVPMMIMPYYSVIGGWVLKYFVVFLTGSGVAASSDDYFTGFISGMEQPIVFMVLFLGLVAFLVFRGVNKGIESSSKIMMPVLILLVIGISLYSLTLSYTDGDGVTRTGSQGLSIYLIPDLSGLTLRDIFLVIMDAMGQLFFSLSVAMGIMISYGSYMKDEVNLGHAVNQIEFFDTLVAFLAGVMVIPAVYCFMGRDGLSAYGPGLMFVSLPKVFAAMGSMGNVIGCLFFVMVFFAALSSGISIMEAVVSSFMDQFHLSRTKATLLETAIALCVGIIVCLGYNRFYFEIKLPNGSTAQILDILDYISNNCLMPAVALGTCILIGWVLKPDTITGEVEKTGQKFQRRRLHSVMIRYIAPALLLVLLLEAVGIL
ncbi:MAG: sodium-dependent transporter [Lachnospiraceae bacterium]|nr:sodium-dependent transporter [Lachnospiraceae bacterium]